MPNFPIYMKTRIPAFSIFAKQLSRMRKSLLFVCFLITLSLSAQNTSLWKGYFSYSEVRDLAQSATLCYAASENALFSSNATTGEIRTINTIDGLPSEQISAAYRSVAFNLTLVGYKSGLMVVILPDGSIIKVVDIINKQLNPTIKKINHFMEHEGVVYISCDFGIVTYNLATLEFGDTYFIGTTSPEIVVTQTTFFDGYIYAATLSEGLKRGALDNPDLIDATQWQSIASGVFLAVEAFGDSILTATSDGQVRRSTSGVSFTSFGPAFSPPISDLRAVDDRLLLVNANHVYTYDLSFVQQAHFMATSVTEEAVAFTCATIVGSKLYIGTKEDGVLLLNADAPSAYEFISPDGPQRNNVFAFTVAPSGTLWTVFGEYDQFQTPYLREYGVSKYSADAGWLNIPYSQMDGARDLVRVTVNPSDETEVFFSSHFDGLVRFQNDVLADHYTYTNSGLESLVIPSAPDYKSVRIEQSAFDSQGNLWMTNGLIDNAVKVLKSGGGWGEASVDGVVDDTFGARFSRLVVDKNNTKWICSLEDGLIGYNENRATPFRRIDEGADAGNLPSQSVQCVAVDNRNQLWIGTRKGLRVLSSVDRFMGEEDTQLTTNSVIILENGLAQELMYEQFVSDIVVDGANNKWIGTTGAGVFLVSPDGQETIHHFTSSNSPLPSNNVNDIDINQTTGEVFFATVSGMVSYKGSAIAPSDDLKDIKVFPNPVRPGYAGTVKITGLTDKANVKIADITGSLVFEAIAEGGTLEWDTTAFGKYRVASGVYMVFVATEDGAETAVKKLMIVR